MNGKCPYCGKEMEQGLIQTGGNNLIWDKKKHGNLIVLPSKEGITLSYQPLKTAYIEPVFRCETCKIMLFPYDN